MTRQDAIEIFGGVPALASALNRSRQAIYQWPEVLDQDRVDLVIGAAVRLGKPVGHLLEKGRAA